LENVPSEDHNHSQIQLYLSVPVVTVLELVQVCSQEAQLRFVIGVLADVKRVDASVLIEVIANVETTKAVMCILMINKPD
jgi:hypothetical protein